MGRSGFAFQAGEVFGRLTVIERGASTPSGLQWRCRCVCGAEVEARGTDLKSGHTASCGCLVVDNNVERSTHGHATRGATTATYHTYNGMLERCTNPNATNWAWYGGRGIGICARWLGSFENFLADMGERPPGMSIDRIDSAGHYEPGNCRWATPKTQGNNRRNARRVEYRGDSVTIAELAERVAIPYDVLYKRIVYRGQSPDDAVLTSTQRSSR